MVGVPARALAQCLRPFKTLGRGIGRGHIRGTLALDEGVFRSHHLPGRARSLSGCSTNGHGLGRLAPERSFGPTRQTRWAWKIAPLAVGFWYAGMPVAHPRSRFHAPKNETFEYKFPSDPPMPTNSDSASEPAQGTPQVPASFQGSLRLFHFAGVDVFIHWSWFLAAFILIRDRPVQYSSMTWDVVEYVIVFGFVLMHEFGHVLACRSVGGTANRILLWPLGGLAFVLPPPRPGACLWTTVAGPLVNVALVPVLFGLMFATAPSSDQPTSDFFNLFQALTVFNLVMLVFNLLPIFPLDGGRILHSLLWYLLGPGLSLAIAAGIGLIAAAGLLIPAVIYQQWWLALTLGFLMLGSFNSLKHARALIAWSRLERRTDRACPHCRSAPPIGPFWKCGQCNSQFDAFETSGVCPNCNLRFGEMMCLDCGKMGAVNSWITEESSDEEERISS